MMDIGPQLQADLPEINAALDPRIAPLVHALRRDGFRTIGSCDGHGDPRVTPWVQIEWPTLGTLEVTTEYAYHGLAIRLLNWFTERGVYVNVGLVFGNYGHHEGSRQPSRFIRIEIFDDLIREAFAW